MFIGEENKVKSLIVSVAKLADVFTSCLFCIITSREMMGVFIHGHSS